MKFELGQPVKTKRNMQMGGLDGKGYINGMHFRNNSKSDEIQYQVMHSTGMCNIYLSSDLSEIKTQTLYAYKDSTDEIHWSTRKYDGKERSNFGFVEAFEFNKTIELE